METMMDKKLRKRMTVMEFERNRKLNAHCSVGSFPLSSFVEIKEERDIAANSARICPDYLYEERDDNDDECNISILSDCVSEMRRRRVYEMHHNRPYPIKNNTKKKHIFWEPEKSPGPAVILKQSLPERCNDATITFHHQESREPLTSLSKNFNGNLEQLSKINTPGVLWKIQTTNLRYDFKPVVLKDRRDLAIESCSDNRSTSYHNEDEIMKPMRIHRPIDSKIPEIDFDAEEIIDEDSIDNVLSTDNLTNSLPASVMTPTDRDNQAAVSEIQTATQALAAFITSAAYVMNEARDPSEMDGIDPWIDKTNCFTLTSKSKDVENSSEINAEDEKRVSFTPIFEGIKFKYSTEACQETTPIKMVNHTANLNTIYTEQNMVTSTPTNKPTVTTPKTADTSMDEADMMICSPSVSFNVVDENVLAVTTLESDVLWPSLFGDSFEGVDSNIKAMLEALVQGGALQRDSSENNTLKLFVDMYHKSTFEKIVQCMKCLKGLHALVICRGLDQNRPTYRSVEEIKTLLDALHSTEVLESLMLLNFTSGSLGNFPSMLSHQSSICRLQIQLVDGTLNGETLGVIATAPRLTHVMLELKTSCPLGMLMNSKTIQSVRVNSKDLVLKDSHVRTLVYSLQSSFTLTSFDLAAEISVDQFRALCTTLKKNYRLETIRVNLVLRTESESTIASLELADLFRENHTLINVWNYSHQSCFVSDTSRREVISGLRNNKSMINFKFFSEDINDWKYTVEENQELISNLNMMSTTSSRNNDGVDYIKMKDDGSLVSCVTGTKSVGTKELALIDFVDDFSPFSTCDCATIRNMGNNFHNWAFATRKNKNKIKINRMEV